MKSPGGNEIAFAQTSSRQNDVEEGSVSGHHPVMARGLCNLKKNPVKDRSIPARLAYGGGPWNVEQSREMIIVALTGSRRHHAHCPRLLYLDPVDEKGRPMMRTGRHPLPDNDVLRHLPLRGGRTRSATQAPSPRSRCRVFFHTFTLRARCFPVSGPDLFLRTFRQHMPVCFP